MRYVVVVGIYPGNMVVLPIYTNSGRGAQCKDELYQLTAMSLWHPSQENDSAVYNLLTKERLLTEGYLTMRPGAHVQLTEPMSVNYKTYVKPHGFLQEESKALLKRRYLPAVQMGFIRNTEKEPTRQTDFFKAEVKKDKIIPPGDPRLARSTQNMNTSQSAPPSSVNGAVAPSRAQS